MFTDKLTGRFCIKYETENVCMVFGDDFHVSVMHLIQFQTHVNINYLNLLKKNMYNTKTFLLLAVNEVEKVLFDLVQIQGD